MSRSLKLGVAAVVILVLVGGVLAVRRGGALVLDAPAIALDLARPDALVQTASLADLPRDLLTVPMFRDVLTEDFVTYYEQTEGRLSLGGTLRRLAYEHDLDLGDRVIHAVIDQPAEIALWKAGDGRLGHSLVVVSRTGLTRILEMAAKVALKDAQLTRVEGDLEVDGGAVPVYALAYARRRVLLFAGHGDRLVILSDAAMLTDRQGRLRGAGPLGRRRAAERTRRAAADLPRPLRARAWRAASHAGRERPLPVVRLPALLSRRERAALRLRARRLGDARAARSRCAARARALHASAVGPRARRARRVRRATRAVAGGRDAGGDGRRRDGGDAAGCRGARRPRRRLLVPEVSALHAALPGADAATARAGGGEAAVLERLFTAAVGAWERSLEGADDPRYAVARAEAADAALWQRHVTARDGVRRRGVGPQAETFFQVSLARHRHAVAFSPDDRLVGEALAVANRQYPSLADVLPDEATVLAVLVPRSLGTLAEAEAFASLPAGQEPVFRNAASTRLVPRLATLKRYPAYALVLPSDATPRADRWLAVEWRRLGRP